MKKMAKLILIRGNSGSGKTSLAKELQKQYNGKSLVISQDIVRREMLAACDGPDTPAIPLIYHLLEFGHRHYDITILEGILLSQWYTPLFEKAFALFDGNIYGYYYDLPLEETITRHNTKAVASEFGELELRRWWRGTDLLKTISERIFTKDISLTDAVKIVCQDIAENSENNPPYILNGHR